ncbi:MAG: hypothetical protein ACYSUV_17985 [Planctomycetota bacterium]
MKTKKLTIILAALVLLSAAIAREGAQEQKEEVSNTLTASCLVKVTCDPAIMPLTFETVDYLMHSSGVAGRAAAEVLGPREEPYEFEVLFSIEPLSVMPATPDLGARPKPAARPTPRRRPTRRRPDDEEGLDDRALKEMMRFQELQEMRQFERTARYQSKAHSEEDQKKRPRPRAARSRQAPDSGKIVRGLTPAGAAAPPATAEQTLLFRLQIDLEDWEVKPAAEEFMKALISNLRSTLFNAHDAYYNKLRPEGRDAELQRDLARSRLSEALGLTSGTDADRHTTKQLKNGVDLSNWSPEMSFFDAINELKHSVDPPLKMVVLWGDLLENAEIDQTTPINMDALPEVRLSKALDFLLKSVASGTGVELGYEIDRGVITIATADSLPSRERRLSQIVKTDAPVERLLSRKEDLFRDKQELEMEIARHEALLPVLEDQIAKINERVTKRLAADPVSIELQKIADLHLRRVEYLRKLVDDGKGEAIADLERTMEKGARVRIELATRREELSSSAGGNELAKLSSHLTELMIDLAVKRAEFEVVGRQLEEIEAQLKAASAVDPEISQIRLAQEELEIAERRLSELRIRRASLWKPTVTVLGGI